MCKDVSDYSPKRQNSIAKNVVWPTLREATADLVHESNTRNVDDIIRAATRPRHSEPVMPETFSSCPLAVNIEEDMMQRRGDRSDERNIDQLVISQLRETCLASL